MDYDIILSLVMAPKSYALEWSFEIDFILIEGLFVVRLLLNDMMSNLKCGVFITFSDSCCLNAFSGCKDDECRYHNSRGRGVCR